MKDVNALLAQVAGILGQVVHYGLLLLGLVFVVTRLAGVKLGGLPVLSPQDLGWLGLYWLGLRAAVTIGR